MTWWWLPRPHDDIYAVWGASAEADASTTTMATTNSTTTMTPAAGAGPSLPIEWTAEIAEYFFVKGQIYIENNVEKRKWTCRCGTLSNGAVKCNSNPLTVKHKGGYSALKTHLTIHEREQGFNPGLAWHNHCSGGAGSMSSYVTVTPPDKKSSAIYGFMKAIIGGDYPFNMVEDKNIRALMAPGTPPICVKTLKRTMFNVATICEEKLAERVPDEFALIVDGWESGRMGYAGVFLSFPYEHDGPNGVRVVTNKQVMLRLTPLNEPGFTAVNYARTIDGMLKRIGKGWPNVVSLTADNTSVNPCLAKLILPGVKEERTNFVGCCAHIFVLATRKWLSKQQEEDNRTVIPQPTSMFVGPWSMKGRKRGWRYSQVPSACRVRSQNWRTTRSKLAHVIARTPDMLKDLPLFVCRFEIEPF